MQPAGYKYRTIRQHDTFFREYVASPFGIALSRSILYHVTCSVPCPVASSLALALPAVALALPAVLQQQLLVTSPHACSLSPESFKLFLFFSLATFSLFSLATSTTATHSLRQSSATLRDRKRTVVPTRPLTRTIVQNNTSAMLL